MRVRALHLCALLLAGARAAAGGHVKASEMPCREGDKKFARFAGDDADSPLREVRLYRLNAATCTWWVHWSSAAADGTSWGMGSDYRSAKPRTPYTNGAMSCQN